MSDCRKISDIIMAARGDIDQRQARFVESHLAACESCRCQLEELRKAARGAGGDVPHVAEERWEKLWRRVEDHMDERRISRQVWRSVFRGLAATAAAAAVLVAAYVFMPSQRVEPIRTTGEFQLVSFEINSPEYDVAILASSDQEIPVIWLERL